MKTHDVEVLSNNLRNLLAAHKERTGANLRQLAEQIAEKKNDIEQVHLWLRRINSQGIARLNRRTEQRLTKLLSILEAEDINTLSKPPAITHTEVIECLRKDYLRQWLLWVSWQMSIGSGVSHTNKILENLIQTGVPRSSRERKLLDACEYKDQAEDFARYFAEQIVDAQLCIVSKLTDPELWELVQNKNDHHAD